MKLGRGIVGNGLYRNQVWLETQYLTSKRKMQDMADDCGVNKTTVLYWLQKYNIPRRRNVDYIKGKELSENVKQRISRAMIEHFKTHDNPMKGCVFSEEHKLKISEAKRGYKRSEEHQQKLANSIKGENNPNWKGGSSFEPYCVLFNDELKEKIRNRGNRVCQLCGKSEIENGRKLSVHHIDGDKMQGCNEKEWYLCALCVSCNSKKDTLEKEFLLVANIGGGK